MAIRIQRCIRLKTMLYMLYVKIIALTHDICARVYASGGLVAICNETHYVYYYCNGSARDTRLTPRGRPEVTIIGFDEQPLIFPELYNVPWSRCNTSRFEPLYVPTLYTDDSVPSLRGKTEWTRLNAVGLHDVLTFGITNYSLTVTVDLVQH